MIEPWIQTYTGKSFWLLESTPDMVDIRDIAHSLSNVCRFAGHTNTFYSVAQHSSLASFYCQPEFAKWGLLHDAAEAYIGDIASPLKRFLGFSIKEIEKNILKTIAIKFGLSLDIPKNVWDIDLALLYKERKLFMKLEPMNWGLPPCIDIEIDDFVPLNPIDAEYVFLQNFHELFGE